MWTRSEMKDRAKASLKGVFWMSVLVVVIYTLLTGGESSNITFKFGQDASSSLDLGNSGLDKIDAYNYYQWFVSYPLKMFLVVFSALAIMVSILWILLVTGPLEMGLSKYFLVNSTNQKDNTLANLFYAFKGRFYANVVIVFFMRNLFILLWSLLLIIPGIIKGYAYSFTPWIMAENPELTYKEALAISTKMTNGEKWNLFVLDLSFIGWRILTLFTLGFASPLVDAYRMATITEVYLEFTKNEMEPEVQEPFPPTDVNRY